MASEIEEIEVDIQKLREALRILGAYERSFRKVYELAEQIEKGMKKTRWLSVSPQVKQRVVKLCKLIGPLKPNPCPPYSCLLCQDSIITKIPKAGRSSR